MPRQKGGSKVREGGFHILWHILAWAIIAAGSWLVGRVAGRNEQRQQFVQALEAAPLKYLDHLSTLIAAADSAKGPDKAKFAQAIVSTRNDLRASLEALGDYLDSDIDRLAGVVDTLNAVQHRHEFDAPPAVRAPIDSQIAVILFVLKEKWPSKRDQFVVGMRKVYAESGLTELTKSPRKGDPPCIASNHLPSCCWLTTA
jgi:hypothetical protein